MIRVAVAGAAGKMGKEVVKAVSLESDLALVAAIDQQAAREDAGTIAGIKALGVPIDASLRLALENKKPDVVVDFTRHESAMANLQESLKHKVACVVGTTGFDDSDFKQIESWCKEAGTPVLIVPNFALGAALLMKFAAEASNYFNWSELIELHHEKKADAPSGTALHTAKLMRQARNHDFAQTTAEKVLKDGVRGASVGGVRIHSVRLPGLVAHQEVMFGGSGEILTLRHDSLSRESFMPGVIFAIRKIGTLKGLVVGLEKILSS